MSSFFDCPAGVKRRDLDQTGRGRGTVVLVATAALILVIAVALPAVFRATFGGVLAARVAISRVALSHIEAGMRTPSERTIVLLAGLLRVEPLELVEGSTYPLPKAERLPPAAPRYTELELRLELLAFARDGCAVDGDEWLTYLSDLEARTYDPEDRELIEAARTALRCLESDSPG